MLTENRARRHRRRIGAAGAAGVLIWFGAVALSGSASGTPAPVSGKGAFDNALIAQTALRYVGRWGGQACVDSHHDQSGQCREFVNCVVSLASHGTVWPVDPHGDYQQGLAGAGGVPVGVAEATTGDIIQVGAHDGDTDLHTAIVLANHYNGVFTVVDANWVGDPGTPELVGVHEYTPPTAARIWRLGSLPGAARAFDLRRAGAAGASTGHVPARPAVTTDALGGIASGSISVHADSVAASVATTTTTTTTTTATAAAVTEPATLMRFWLDGQPLATVPVTGQTGVLPLDTTTLADGAHQLAAQAVGADGAISALGDPVTVTVANTQLAVAALVPPGPLAGSVPVTVAAAPAAAVAQYSLSVDGQPVLSQPAGAGSTLLLNTSTLTTGTLAPGRHTVTVTATDTLGRPVTSAPVTLTVAGAATAHRVTLPSATPGRDDLAAVDPGGHLLRYPWVGDDAFGPAQPLADGFSTVKALLSGHFTGPDSGPELLAAGPDGAMRLYTLSAATGKLSPPTVITGVAWAGYANFVAGDFAGAGTSQLLAVTADGHTDIVTIAADGDTATAHAVAVTPAVSHAASLITAPAAGARHDRILAIAADGTVTTQEYDTKAWAFLADPGPVPGKVTLGLPAGGTPALAGAFSTDGTVRLLVTTPDGMTAAWGADPVPVAPVAAPPSPPSPGATPGRTGTAAAPNQPTAPNTAQTPNQPAPTRPAAPSPTPATPQPVTFRSESPVAGQSEAPAQQGSSRTEDLV